jgi:hypothetical protein
VYVGAQHIFGGRKAGERKEGHLHIPVSVSSVIQDPTLCIATKRRMYGFEGAQSLSLFLFIYFGGMEFELRALRLLAGATT